VAIWLNRSLTPCSQGHPADVPFGLSLSGLDASLRPPGRASQGIDSHRRDVSAARGVVGRAPRVDGEVIKVRLVLAGLRPTADTTRRWTKATRDCARTTRGCPKSTRRRAETTRRCFEGTQRARSMTGPGSRGTRRGGECSAGSAARTRRRVDTTLAGVDGDLPAGRTTGRSAEDLRRGVESTAASAEATRRRVEAPRDCFDGSRRTGAGNRRGAAGTRGGPIPTWGWKYRGFRQDVCTNAGKSGTDPMLFTLLFLVSMSSAGSVVRCLCAVRAVWFVA